MTTKIRRFITKFIPTKVIQKHSSNLISSILMAHNGTTGMQLMIIGINKVIRVKRQRFVEFTCQDHTGKTYYVLLDDFDVIDMIRNDSFFKCPHSDGMIFIKEAENDK